MKALWLPGFVAFCLAGIHGGSGIDHDGLVTTPFLGYAASDELLKITVDEVAIRDIAERLVADHFAANYQYLIIHGPWTESKRDHIGFLSVNTTLFPSGLRNLATFVHSRDPVHQCSKHWALQREGCTREGNPQSYHKWVIPQKVWVLQQSPSNHLKVDYRTGNKGLKLGLLISAEPSGAFPGSRGHEEGDAEQYVDWGIDLLLYQAAATDTLVEDCKAMKAALDATGGSFVFALASGGAADPWLWPQGLVQSWRTTIDTQPTWESLQQVVDDSVGLSRYAHPGSWNDLGLLQIGRPWLVLPEQRAMFGLWAMLKSPLMLAADLRFLGPLSRDIVLAPEVIGVSQDPLGIAGDRVWKQGPLEVYAGPLSGGGRVVALWNRHTFGVQYPLSNITVTWEQLGYPAHIKARVRDLYRRSDIDVCSKSFTGLVDLHNIMLLKITPLESLPEYIDWRPWGARRPAAIA